MEPQAPPPPSSTAAPPPPIPLAATLAGNRTAAAGRTCRCWHELTRREKRSQKRQHPRKQCCSVNPFFSAAMASSCSFGVYPPLGRPIKRTTLSTLPPALARIGVDAVGMALLRGSVVCFSAVQESSTATVAGKEAEPAEQEAAAAAEKPKRKPPVKAPAKPLPQMMEEDVIPSLRATLEGEEDISGVELSFSDNRLEGSFMKKDIPHYFWAFFPDGSLTGPKGFSLSSYGSEVSTVEPFLIDEKKITARHVVFWVQKRLAAQGIIPVWKE